jgi:putative heme-binding domain-containing protein
MTCKINRDSYIEHGSTRTAKEEPDFLSSDDPWFRPVNIEFGPDGGMYIADFYNRIIGHYEVPLDHPGRDRERGRIWRVVYKDPNGSKNKALDALVSTNKNRFDLSKASVAKLIDELASPNIRRRMLATDELVDRVGAPAVKPVAKMMGSKKSDAHQRAHGLWVLHRLGGVDQKILTACANDNDRLVRVHAMRVLAEMQYLNNEQEALAQHGMFDKDGYVQRAAVDAIGRHEMRQNVPWLLKVRASEPKEDEALVYMTRMALRNQLLSDSTFNAVASSNLSEQDQRAIADVCIAINTAASGAFLVSYLEHADESRPQMEAYLKHIARYAPDSAMDKLAAFTRKRFADDMDFQLTLFKSVEEGIQQRGGTLGQSLNEWGTELAQQLMVSVDAKKLDWRNSSIKGEDATNPWVLQERPSADGKKVMLISSLAPGGESLTGILRSREFVIPKKLSFWLAGHDGSPDKPLAKKNYVRLHEAGTDKVIKSVQPPRNDTAQRITWDIPNYAGKKGYIEVVDRNRGHSYAWLAAGQFSPEVVPMPSVIPNQIDTRQKSAAELAAQLKVASLEKPLDELFVDDSANEASRAAAAKALMVLNPTAHAGDVAKVVQNPAEPQKLREECAKVLGESKSADVDTVIVGALATAPQSLQVQLALTLVSKADGAEALLAAVETGKASRQLLQDKVIKDRLLASNPKNGTARIETLTRGLPTQDAERQKLIDERAAAFNAKDATIGMGMQVFKKNCIACHQLDGEGALIGPQLDGIGNRGADRIIEDILDPSRNVDPAFRVTLFTTKDGDTESGLFRREEGQMVIYADSTGKEHSLAKTEIGERRQSALSLMPDNFGQVIKTEDFNNLIAYLLSKNGKIASKK